MDIEKLKRFPRIAQQTVLQALCFVNVIIMKYDKLSFFYQRTLLAMKEPVVKEFRLTVGFVTKST